MIIRAPDGREQSVNRYGGQIRCSCNGGQNSLVSPLERAGIVGTQAGDVILSFDAKQVSNIGQQWISTAKFSSRKASTEQRRRPDARNWSAIRSVTYSLQTKIRRKQVFDRGT